MSAANRSTVAFITGGGSGIGAGLAKAFHARGAKVVIGGRNMAALEAVAQAYAGIETVHIDVADATSVTRCAGEIAERFPKLNTLVNNAGVQRLLDFNAAPPSAAEIAEEIDINLKGLIHVTAAFLPLLRRQSAARIIHVSSGLAFVPLANAPVYSATKAAVHSFALSLRKQLAGTAVLVIELIPPLVETNLNRDHAKKSPGSMPLDDFITASMRALDSGREELPIGLAKVLSVASRAAPGLFMRIINKPR